MLVDPTQVSDQMDGIPCICIEQPCDFFESLNYEPTHVLIAIRKMLVGVDTFSLTLNRRLSMENELIRKHKE